MAGSFFNGKDSMDISELASLNNDISDDLIEQLQQQLTQNVSDFSDKSGAKVNLDDDSTLFEETSQQSAESTESVSDNEGQASSETHTEPVDAGLTGEADQESDAKKEEVTVNKNFDDNFIKKYKAKLNKRAMGAADAGDTADKNTSEDEAQDEEAIENLSQGNITERPLTKELKDYNDSLDFLDGNVKYSKYVIYIDPQNVDFIEGLTVKERKNLINGILREQDDIAMTKKRFRVLQSIMRHAIVAILTLSISIPIVYYAINASLEATIDNHRRSQSNWQTLYRDHGKITQH